MKNKTTITLIRSVVLSISGLLFKFAAEAQLPNPNSSNKQLDVSILEHLKQSSNQIWFQTNAGQYPSKVNYAFNTSFGSVAIYDDKIRFMSVQRDTPDSEGERELLGVHMADLKFINSNSSWSIVALNPNAVSVNYMDTDGNMMAPGVYGEILITNIYDGMTLRMYGAADSKLEFDWLIDDPERVQNIKMEFTGQDAIEVDASGIMKLKFRKNELIFDMPETYQIINNEKVAVKVKCRLDSSSNTVSYDLMGSYDAASAIIIDPVVEWSTYIENNTTTFDEYAYAIAVNANGVYVAGNSDDQMTRGYMSNISGGFDSTLNGAMSAIIYKLNGTGTAVTAWTYADAGDKPVDMDLFSDGRVLIAYNTSNQVDIFNAALTSRVATAAIDYIPQSVEVADTNAFFVSGYCTSSLGALIAGTAPDPAFSGTNEGVIVRYNVTGAVITSQWGTYLGGSTAGETFTSIDITPNASYLVFAGSTSSTSTFPALVNAVDAIHAGSEFLVGTLLNQGTMPGGFTTLSFLGGASNETIPVISSDNKYMYVAGTTNSSTLPGTAGRYQTSLAGSTDLFISRVPLLGSVSSGFISSFLGGSNQDKIGGVSINLRTGNILVLGTADASGAFPTQNTTPASQFYESTNSGGLDITYTQLDSNLTNLIFSSYIGGAGNDYWGATGNLIGSGHMYYYGLNDLIYLATTTHSNNDLPAQFMSAIPGFDKAKSNTTDDAHLIFAFNQNSYDYSDAPDSYDGGGSPPANPAVEAVSNYLRIGNSIDADPGYLNGSNAISDDTLVSPADDDEDGIASFPVLAVGQTSYSLAVSVFNNTGSTVDVHGWIDFDLNGTFDADEYASNTVTTSTSQQSTTLTWSTFPGLTDGQSFVRIRLSSAILDANGAMGVGNTGEIEDYPLVISIPLPIGLVEFTGRFINDHVALQWKTTENKDCDFFELEKAGDDGVFKFLTKLDNNDPFSQESQYNYRDVNPFKGENFYRLHIVENNGFQKYSNIILVVTDIESALQRLNIVPQPVTDAVELGNLLKGTRISIMDLTGRVCLTMLAGSNSESLDMSNFPKGMYLLKVHYNNFTNTVRVFKE